MRAQRTICMHRQPHHAPTSAARFFPVVHPSRTFFKGHHGEYPFHFDDPALVEGFFRTLQSRFLEVFHPYLITSRAYGLLR